MTRPMFLLNLFSSLSLKDITQLDFCVLLISKCWRNKQCNYINIPAFQYVVALIIEPVRFQHEFKLVGCKSALLDAYGSTVGVM